LAWVLALPMMFWLVSGFVMVARPIAEIRADHLLRPVPAVTLTAPPVPPNLAGLKVAELSLEGRAAGPRWIARIAGIEQPRLADPATGAWLPALSAADATGEVLARYAGTAKVARVTRVTPQDYHLEVRRRMDGWRVEMDDATHFFVEAGSAAIIAHRTRQWRVYDWFWGLHILDLQGRKDPHNPWIVTFSALSLLMLAAGIAILIGGKGAEEQPAPVSPPARPRRAPRQRPPAATNEQG
jgi:hypothetical protein